MIILLLSVIVNITNGFIKNKVYKNSLQLKYSINNKRPSSDDENN